MLNIIIKCDKHAPLKAELTNTAVLDIRCPTDMVKDQHIMEVVLGHLASITKHMILRQIITLKTDLNAGTVESQIIWLVTAAIDNQLLVISVEKMGTNRNFALSTVSIR